MSDLDFYFDPVCPFAWMASKWVRIVAGQRPLDVMWRCIALRFVNEGADYAAMPEGYEAVHDLGLRLLRVAVAVRDRHGPEAVGALYETYGSAIFDGHPGTRDEILADLPAFASAALRHVGLDPVLVDALDDATRDIVIRNETEHALNVTGRDVGTPILQFDPPDGMSFFGPVISRLPSPEDAVALWDHVTGLAHFAGFAELKRSLRETPQLRALGADGDGAHAGAGTGQDWWQGRRPGPE